MNPAEAAEEAPSDPDTDAFYKTGRKSRAAANLQKSAESILSVVNDTEQAHETK